MKKNSRKMKGFQGQYLKTASVLNLYIYYLLVKEGLEKMYPKDYKTNKEYKNLIKYLKGLLPVFQVNALEYEDTFGNKCIIFNDQVEITLLAKNKQERKEIRDIMNAQEYVLMSSEDNDGNLRVLINVRHINVNDFDYETLIIKYDNIYNTWVYFISNYLRKKYGFLIDNCPERSFSDKVEYNFDDEAYCNENAKVFSFKRMKGVKELNKILNEFMNEAADKPCFKGFRHRRIASKTMSLHLNNGYNIGDIKKFINHCCNDLGESQREYIANNSIATKKENDERDIINTLEPREYFKRVLKGDVLKETMEYYDSLDKNMAHQNRDKSA